MMIPSGLVPGAEWLPFLAQLALKATLILAVTAMVAAVRYVPGEKLQDWSKELDARKSKTPMDWQAVNAHDMRNLREMRRTWCWWTPIRSPTSATPGASAQ